MTLQEYLDHYLNIKEMLLFFAVAMIGVILCVLIIVLVGRLTAIGNSKFEKKQDIYYHTHNMVQRFYEMIFSASSILSFLAAYYLIDRFIVSGPVRVFWDKHSDMLLLLMIIISVVINNYFDHLLIPLKKIDHDEKASVRVVAMLYIMLIFFYIKFIYENDNYDGFIIYFLGLMVGRFVYFDASFKDFIKTIKDAAKNLPLLILGLAYTGFMCYYGFFTKYLLKSNGVLVSTFFAHVFMIVAIFIVHHSHFVDIFVKKPKGKTKKHREQDFTSDNSDEDNITYDDYSDRDDEYLDMEITYEDR